MEQSEKSVENLQAIFENWVNLCLQKHDDTIHETLRRYAKDCFSSHPKLQSQGSKSNLESNDILSQHVAELVAKLSPVFSITLKDDDEFYPPEAGLYVLCGAFEGILNSSSQRGLSVKIQQLLGHFLAERCRMDTNHQQIKDIAIMCLHAFFKISNISMLEKEGKDLLLAKQKCMIWRLSTSRKAVMLSAGAIPEDDDEDMMEVNDDENPYSVGDISDFTRLKRTACFQILLSALDGFSLDSSISIPEEIINPTDVDIMESHTSLITELAKFTSFCTKCLHGESDPRCLVFLLTLIRKCQDEFLPFFAMKNNEKTGIQLSPFPTTQIFDAVAPYYPIKFTPPPNVENAITRDDLHNALMDVLTCYPPTKSHSNSSMVELSCRLFLERILPDTHDDDYGMSPGPDELNTPVDKLEALEDIKNLFTVKPRYAPNELRDDLIKLIPFNFLDDVTLVDLAEALMETHSEAAKGDTDPSSSTPSEEKLLASQCRSFAIYILTTLESQKLQNASLSSSKWKTFLNPITNSLCSNVTSAPESFRGRTSAAFLSAIAYSGTETLRLCLQSILPPLLSSIKSTLENLDEERITASCYTLAGFFGAVTKLEQIRKKEHNGKVILLHPHPLASYSEQAFQILYSLLEEVDNKSMDESDTTAKENSSRLGFDARASAVYALEALLLACPKYAFKNDGIDIQNDVKQFLLLLLESVCGREDVATKSNEKWSEMCSHAIGSFIGKCNLQNDIDMETNDNDDGYSYLSSFSQTIQSEVIPVLIQSSIKAQTKIERDTRYDWKTLARGCNLNRKVSSNIIFSIGTSLMEALNSNQLSPIATANGEQVNIENAVAINASMALSFMMEKGGDFVEDAWEDAFIDVEFSEDSLVMKEHIGYLILRALCGYKDGSHVNIIQSDTDDVVMDKLLLPNKKLSARIKAEGLTKVASSIIPHLIPCYKKSTENLLNSIVRFVSPVIPPLSLLDNTKVTITLPILSASLQTANIFSILDTEIETSLTRTTHEELRDMIPSLCEFILSYENKSVIRSAAASIVYSFLSKSPDVANLAYSIIENSISPAFQLAANEVTLNLRGSISDRVFGYFEDALNLMSLVGSSAASKGGFETAQVTDKIVKFIVCIICSGEGTLPVTGMNVLIPPEFRSEMSVVAGQAFGSMLSVENENFFWKQRVCYKTLPDIFKSCENGKGSSVTKSFGAYIVAAHMICCVSSKALGDENVQKLFSCIIHKLVSTTNSLTGESISPEDSFVNLALAALVKLLSVSPNLILPIAADLIQPLLNLSCSDKASMHMISIALQCISTIINFPDVKQGMNATLKSTVEEKLSFLLDHKSRVVRQMTVAKAKMSSEQRVREEIRKSLQIWGVDPQRNDLHNFFFSDTIDTVVSYYHGHHDSTDNDKCAKKKISTKFPPKVVDAIRYVLMAAPQILDKESYHLRHDRLGNFYPPYFIGKRDGNLCKSKDMKMFSKEEIDPFKRFTKTEVSKAEYFYRQWFDPNNPSYLEGLVFEGIVTCHVIQKEACYNCKKRGGLEWNGDIAWQDMWCRYCGSSYEIKSKASLEAIEKVFDRNSLNGGSFFMYHQHRHNEIYSNPKRYVIVVSRSSKKTFGKVMWPTYIAEIKTVKPRLHDKSFDLKPRLKLGTTIVAGKKKLWMCIPFVEYDIESIAKDAFQQSFSEQEWSELNQRQIFDNSSEHKSNQEKSTNVDSLCNDMQALSVDRDFFWNRSRLSNTKK